MVLAGPGSGKTTVITHRVKYLINEFGVNPSSILVVTFTKAAAAQMREKITARIQKALVSDPENEHLQRQETLIHNAQITTIDSFCQYIIRNNFNVIGLDPSFRVGDEGELKLLQEEVMAQLLEAEKNGVPQGSGISVIFSVVPYCILLSAHRFVSAGAAPAPARPSLSPSSPRPLRRRRSGG